MRLMVATCTVDYVGKLSAHLPSATRLLLIKSDGSVSVHCDDRAYKPLNWMNPPCTTQVTVEAGGGQKWTVENRTGDRLEISISDIWHDSTHELGVDPGLLKDGVEAHLQQLLADQPDVFGPSWRLVRREFPTAIGPVDLMFRDESERSVAVEVKRRGDIDGVEQLSRYLELLNRDPLLSPVRGVFAAQEVKPQARVLAEDRGIRVLVVDYDALRGQDDPESRLF